METNKRIYTDSDNLGGAVLFLIIEMLLFITILPLSPNAALCTLLLTLGVYLLKTGITGRF